MQNAPGDSAVPGALGLGQSRATTIFNSYYMFSFLTPIPFAVLSDAWIGRYKVLCLSLRYRRFVFAPIRACADGIQRVPMWHTCPVPDILAIVVRS